MSQKIPPDTLMYSMGGGAGSRLVIFTMCTSPMAIRRRPPACTAACAGSNRRLKPTCSGTPAALDGPNGAVDLFEVQRHRLLQEDRLAGLGRGHDEVHVGVGARADRHRIGIARP